MGSWGFSRKGGGGAYVSFPYLTASVRNLGLRRMKEGGNIERVSPTVESRADRGVPNTCFRCLLSMAHAVIVWVGGDMEEEHVDPLAPLLKLSQTSDFAMWC